MIGSVAAGASQIVAVDARASRLERARELGATSTVEWQGTPAEVAAAVRDASGGGVDYAFEARGRPAAAEAAFLSTRVRGAAVLCGIPRADATITLPALSIPRMERRVLGSIYGSARPDRDFPLILDMYRRGHLPIDRLISHRLAAGRGRRGDGSRALGRRHPRPPRAGLSFGDCPLEHGDSPRFSRYSPAAAAFGWWR